jgi:AcrR family transcriptional regulator
MTPATTRSRIVDAASALLREGGREAVSTRAVSALAGVQAPAIYRIFKDKKGLLDAVASEGFESYLRSKNAMRTSDDPVEDLRRGWDLHVGFGVSQPAFYTLIYGEPRPGEESPAAAEAARVLAGQVRRIAAAGRLRTTEERAARLIHAAGSGVVFTLIALPPTQRDPELSTLARESVIATVTTEKPPAGVDDGVAGNATMLRAALPGLSALTDGERGLLGELLDRISRTGSGRRPSPGSSSPPG